MPTTFAQKRSALLRLDECRPGHVVAAPVRGKQKLAPQERLNRESAPNLQAPDARNVVSTFDTGPHLHAAGRVDPAAAGGRQGAQDDGAAGGPRKRLPLHLAQGRSPRHHVPVRPTPLCVSLWASLLSAHQQMLPGQRSLSAFVFCSPLLMRALRHACSSEATLSCCGRQQHPMCGSAAAVRNARHMFFQLVEQQIILVHSHLQITQERGNAVQQCFGIPPCQQEHKARIFPAG